VIVFREFARISSSSRDITRCSLAPRMRREYRVIPKGGDNTAMSSTIFEQPNRGSRWKAWSQRWLSLQTEKVGQMAHPGNSRRRNSRRTAEIAHMYLPDGDIEYICMSCLGVVCRVRHLEDALIHQQTHTCGRQEPAVDLARKMI